MAHAEPPRIDVTVVYSPRAGEVDQVVVRLPPGATLHDALLISGLLTRHPSIDLAQHRVGVWGKLRTLDVPLRDQDRVEVYRPLLIDPKEARRQRQRKQQQRLV